MKKVSNIGTLVVALAMGLSFARCSDDYDLQGTTIINNKTYIFHGVGTKENHLKIVPFDSTEGYYFYDGHNRRRLIGQGDYFSRFNPKTGDILEVVSYGNPKFEQADSMYVAELKILHDTNAARSARSLGMK